MLLLYTNQTSPRLAYTTNFIQSIIGEAITVTSDRELFTQTEGVKISYSDDAVCNKVYHIQPQGLLFQNSIEPIDIEIISCREQICFFASQNDSHGFDVLSATFYLITRYEEYLPHEKDMYGRFAYTQSLAYQHGFLHLPLVNFWAVDLLQQLQRFYPNFTYQLPAFKYIPSYDIDIAYAYRYQSIFKNVGGFFKDMLRGDLDKITERANVYSGKMADPFDTFDWLHQLHQQHQLNPIYFFLMANKKGVYDKNVSPDSQGMQQLIKLHHQQYAIGIHPSWQSGDDNALMIAEKNSLEKITEQPCTISRQHYIRLTLPQTYQHLQSAGIQDDYSMGYGSINGFRASVTVPFYWYDLEKETTTTLLVHPFCYMEANSFFEQQYTAEEAAKELEQYHTVVKKVGGQLITLFHNHFITTQPQWLPWRKMYADFLQQHF